jgi:predicted MFS family arabinose efflux permease
MVMIFFSAFQNDTPQIVMFVVFSLAMIAYAYIEILIEDARSRSSSTFDLILLVNGAFRVS